MVIIELTYQKPLSEVENFLEGHKLFLKKYYKQKVFIMSGPKEPREGGIILANISLDVANKIIKEDPFYCENIANYKLTVFNPNRFNSKLQEVFLPGFNFS